MTEKITGVQQNSEDPEFDQVSGLSTSIAVQLASRALAEGQFVRFIGTDEVLVPPNGELKRLGQLTWPEMQLLLAQIYY